VAAVDPANLVNKVFQRAVKHLVRPSIRKAAAEHNDNVALSARFVELLLDDVGPVLHDPEIIHSNSHLAQR